MPGRGMDQEDVSVSFDGGEDQLEVLSGQLEKESRIKEGAEKLLKMQLTDVLRSQVESELDMAMKEIESLTKKIEIESSRGKRRRVGLNGATLNGKRKFAGQAPPVGVKLREDFEERDRDDFQTALSNANHLIQSLINVSKSGGNLSPVGSLSPPAPNADTFSTGDESSGAGDTLAREFLINPSTSSKDSDRTRVSLMNRLVDVLQRNIRVRYELDLEELMSGVLPALADNCSKFSRAAAYRLIRYALVDYDSVVQLSGLRSWRDPVRSEQEGVSRAGVLGSGLDWFIVKSLSRDAKYSIEKEQVIKLIRAIVEVAAERWRAGVGVGASEGKSGRRRSTGDDVRFGLSQSSNGGSRSSSHPSASFTSSLGLVVDAGPSTSSQLHPSSSAPVSANFSTPTLSSPAAIIPLSEPVMRAFIALAEHAEDPLRSVCVQTLGEMIVIDIDLISRTGGIRFLLHFLGEMPGASTAEKPKSTTHTNGVEGGGADGINLGWSMNTGPLRAGAGEMAPLLAAAFLQVVDTPRGRRYLNVGRDLEIALSAVTDAYGKGPEHVDRMRGCTRVIQLMMRTWSGLMYFCMEDRAAIRSIVDTLRIPSLDTREIILDMFFDLLNIKTLEWYQTFIDGRRYTMYRRAQFSLSSITFMGENNSSEYGMRSEQPQETLKLTDQYIALLILIFTEAGLLDALTEILEECATGSNLSRKAIILMAEILQMGNRVLPLSMAAKIQAIPRVFDLASDFTSGEGRIIGTSALSAIDGFNRSRARLQSSMDMRNIGNRPRANSGEDAVKRGQRQVEQVKLKLSMQMDDRTFQSSLMETQVMITKDHTKWNFDMLQELIEGPLLNPKRMEEVIKVSRFMRKLVSFFHPFGHRFSEVPRKQPNIRWVRLGCSLLTTLLASPDGVRFLSSEDEFMKQMVQSFAQLDPFNGPPESDTIFSKKRLAETLTYGYLEMLGVLSKHPEGIEIMEKSRIFTAFYHLSELDDREDLIAGIITNLDYSIDGHPRIVLSKALTSRYTRIRLYATNHLGELIQSSVNPNAWSLRLLLTQLYDPSPEVRGMAVHFLEEACDAMEVLQLVVEMQPTMDHLGEIGHPLLLRFMSTTTGFNYLYDAGYIDREVDMWFHERNIYYVVQMEIFLSRAFSPDSAEDDEDVLAFDGIVPPHFYGEMSKTEFGCQILQEKGHFVEFAQFIRQHGLEKDDTEMILKLKSILWAVGNIGATEGGLLFLEEEEIIPTILEITEHSLIPSVRGTCFFVLGLISSTSQGAEILDDYHWEATLSPLGIPTGLCIPVDLDKFISMPSWEPVQSRVDEEPRLLPPATQAESEVMTAIENLSNTVIANAASRSLARMKSRPEYRSVFSSCSVFYRALHLMSTQRYRLPVRRYIFDLFNIQLDCNVIKLLAQTAISLRAPPSFKPPNPQPDRVVSMFGRLGRPRRGSESDEGEDDMDAETDAEETVEKKPIFTLRPVSRIIGFNQ